MSREGTFSNRAHGVDAPFLVKDEGYEEIFVVGTECDTIVFTEQYACDAGVCFRAETGCVGTG